MYHLPTMKRILSLYIIREITSLFLLGIAIFTLILLMGRLIKLTDMVISRGVPLGDVSRMIIYLMPSFLVFTIPMAFLLAVLLAFGRLSADNEITVLKAGGISLAQLMPPVLVCAVAASLLALAAGMANSLKSSRYEKLLVSRPVIPLGRDIGYLPGTKDEKMQLWMQPIFDNLSYLIGLTNGGKQDAATELGIKRLLQEDRIELEALTYIRGRSISRQYVIIDEAQNLTPHEVKTIVSRAGEGTKMVLTGDPEQIDNPYLDASSNGLSYTVERLKGQEACGHITLIRSERSHLASLAAEYL